MKTDKNVLLNFVSMRWYGHDKNKIKFFEDLNYFDRVSLIAFRTAFATSSAPGKSPCTQIETFFVDSGNFRSAPLRDFQVPVSSIVRTCFAEDEILSRCLEIISHRERIRLTRV